VAEIINNLNRNAQNAQNVVREAVRALPRERGCKCGEALRHAIVTEHELIPAATRKRLTAIVGKYLS